MKLRTLDHRTAAPINLRCAALAPAGKGSYGNGRGGRPWRRIREAVLKRDGFQCQPCKATGRVTLATEVDHIQAKFEGGTDQMHNLQAICGTCHQVKSNAESQRAKQR